MTGINARHVEAFVIDGQLTKNLAVIHDVNDSGDTFATQSGVTIFIDTPGPADALVSSRQRSQEPTMRTQPQAATSPSPLAVSTVRPARRILSAAPKIAWTVFSLTSFSPSQFRT